MKEISRHPSSFRDPAGTVFLSEQRIVRGLTAEGATRYGAVQKTGFLDLLEGQNKIVKTVTIDLNEDPRFVRYLEHEKIKFVSYPYEWPFLMLREAALLHLSIQLEALNHDIVLSDASAYNIQFDGISPLFIDILSFRSYESGEYWTAHSQFCEQFLNPLLLTALKAVPYQEWYRGNLEGITTESIAKLMPLTSWLSVKNLIHILLPARGNKASARTNFNKTLLPKSVYIKLLKQLSSWISALEPRKQVTTWQNYTNTRLYSLPEVSEKKNFVAEFVTKTTPATLWDLGCNDGEFAELALAHGAGYVIGFDLDLGALDKAVLRAKEKNLPFLPLYQRLTNPSPNHGWLSQERSSLQERGAPNAILALAFIHHLALGHNIPLDEIVSWLLQLAPMGVIEFVQKSDPTVKQMLQLKGDIFPHYSEENFTKLLMSQAQIIKKQKISQSGRCLFWYQVV